MTKTSSVQSDLAPELWEDRVKEERSARHAAERTLLAKSRELQGATLALSQTKTALEAKLDELENERDRALMLSRTDPLTRLTNRSALLSDLESKFAARHDLENDVWLFLFDIRRFKQVNTSFGQTTGDNVLKTLAHRLDKVGMEFRGTAARFGGAEFALLVELDSRTVGSFSVELVETMHLPVRIQGREVQIEFAIGAVGTNLDFDNADAFRNAADYALAKARNDGTEHVLIFDQNHQDEIAHRSEFEVLLRRAIQRYRIEPWFQPIIHPHDPSKVSLEVLARWPETNGAVLPSEFIPAAEEIGLRRQLDRWLIRIALQQSKDWVNRGLVQDVNINVPPNDLMSPDFVDDLNVLLNETNFPRDRLVVEVTESVFIEDLEFVNRQLDKLSKLGVKIALDDFGTGYSNLRSLVGLPLSKIKLDKSLISDMESNHRVAMLVSTFIQWARASNLSIVAEGVETEAQAALLKALGCTSLQGFLYGQAMAATDIETHLTDDEGFGF